MSYDFAVVTPEASGKDEAAALAAALAIFEGGDTAGGAVDPRVRAFLEGLEAAGAADEEAGWVSVRPLWAEPQGLAVPTTYADVDSNLVTLLRLAAREGLVVVDLSSQKVDYPSEGTPVGVKAGDGTRLGALSRERLSSLLLHLPPSDPWIVLEHGAEMYAQARRRGDGSFDVEYRDGGPQAHFGTTVSDVRVVLDLLWRWIEGDPTWKHGISWTKVEF